MTAEQDRARNRRELEQMDGSLEQVENALLDAAARAGALAGVIETERAKLARLLGRNAPQEDVPEAQAELEPAP